MAPPEESVNRVSHGCIILQPFNPTELQKPNRNRSNRLIHFTRHFASPLSMHWILHISFVSGFKRGHDVNARIGDCRASYLQNFPWEGVMSLRTESEIGLMSVRIGNVHFWRHSSKLALETLDLVAQQLCESLVAGSSLLRVLTNQWFNCWLILLDTG